MVGVLVSGWGRGILAGLGWGWGRGKGEGDGERGWGWSCLWRGWVEIQAVLAGGVGFVGQLSDGTMNSWFFGDGMMSVE